MALSSESKSLIEQKMAEVIKCRRPGMTHVAFLDDYGSIIANTEKNSTALINAGLDGTQLPYYRDCLEMLTLTIGGQTGTDQESETKSQEYYTLASTNKVSRKELGIVGKHIAKNCGNRKIQQKYKQILKGSGDADDALDIISFVSIIEKYPLLAAKIRPDGKIIDEQYCANAKKNALALLLLKGYVIVNGVPQNSGSDYLNKLITVCMDNQTHIKEFAEAAFCNKPDFYKANFASKYRKNTSEDDDIEIDTAEDTSKNPIDAVTITDDSLTGSTSKK
ncbi:MAG TPA: hypothetical protein VHO70_02135 [Chitinispirillaceae bacterium]|nr:hypothetical protein [Chitinispirillaceae bacterium]